MFVTATILTIYEISYPPYSSIHSLIHPFMHFSFNKYFCAPLALQYCSKPVFLNLHTDDIWAQIIINCGMAIWCIEWHLAASHLMSVTSPTNCDNQNVLWHCQLSLGGQCLIAPSWEHYSRECKHEQDIVPDLISKHLGGGGQYGNTWLQYVTIIIITIITIN